MSAIREAASVIVVREDRGAGLEVLLLRRHRRSGFMASSFVFPGGVAEPGDADPRVTAARELFEEAGVLLARGPGGETIDSGVRQRWRDEVAGGADAGALLTGAGGQWALEELHYFAHWITPSAEKRRYSARFFIAPLPPGQEPAFDDVETVEQIWIGPAAALERAGELKLPPPQVRTLAEMRPRSSLADLIEESRARAARPAAILPRLANTDTGFALLLPWDPDYAERGTGDALAIPADHPLAAGPSRFVFEDGTWKNVEPPGSRPAGS
jgi:8-oxo-dGTP pyrophosphatase MutT (NUDIX family)